MSHKVYGYGAGEPGNRIDPSGRYSISTTKRCIACLIKEAYLHCTHSTRHCKERLNLSAVGILLWVYCVGGHCAKRAVRGCKSVCNNTPRLPPGGGGSSGQPQEIPLTP